MPVLRRPHDRHRDFRARMRAQAPAHAASSSNPYNPASASPNPRQNPHSARGTAPAYVPRFRALALFGRRPQERVEGFVMPASKNLHNTGLGRLDVALDLAATNQWTVVDMKRTG